MSRRRRFGRVRKLPSGRWQARYSGPDGIDRPAPATFASKTDAEVWLTLTEAEIRQGDWINPDAGVISLAEYGTKWIGERPGLRPKTIELYTYLFRKQLVPVLGPMPIADIQPGHVRTWRKGLLDQGVSEVTAAKAYRLLKTILSTAADDGAIRRNPCRIKGAGAETSPERPMLTVSEVFTLSEAVEPRYRALILLAAFTSLRWGELCALRPNDIDLDTRTIRVHRTLTELQNGETSFGPPKSAAGRRTVGFPKLISQALADHLDGQAAKDDLIFTGPNGGVLRRGNFRQRVWLPAIAAAGLPQVHFHDLRHTGNTLTATAGANPRELMARMGHASPRAALIYLHSTDARQRQIADALGDLAAAELDRARSGHGSTNLRKEEQKENQQEAD